MFDLWHFAPLKRGCANSVVGLELVHAAMSLVFVPACPSEARWCMIFCPFQAVLHGVPFTGGCKS